MTWTVERVRALAQAFAPKRRERVLKVLEERGLEAGVAALLLAQKVQAREDAPPHPLISDGNLTSIQRDVLEGLNQGFSVNKISRLYGHKKDTIKKAKASFQRKGLVPLVPSSTPPRSDEGDGEKGSIGAAMP